MLNTNLNRLFSIMPDLETDYDHEEDDYEEDMPEEMTPEFKFDTPERRKQGVFVGLLKPVPNPKITLEYVRDFKRKAMKLYGDDRSRFFVHAKMPAYINTCSVSAFPSCCATSILHGFPYELNNRLPGTNVYVPAENNFTALALELEQLIKDITISGRSYLVATLNGTQMKNRIGELLVDYLGFSRLEDDIVNRTGSNNVALYGIALNRYSEENL